MLSLCLRSYKDWWLYDNELYCTGYVNMSCHATEVNHIRGSNTWVLFTVVLSNLIMSFPHVFVTFLVLCRMLIGVICCGFDFAFDSFSLLFPFWGPSEFLFNVGFVLPIYYAMVWVTKPLSSVLLMYAVYLSHTDPAGESQVYQICNGEAKYPERDPCYNESVAHTNSKITAIQLCVLNLHCTVDWVLTVLSCCGIRLNSY
jgi:hypothetical protein